MVILYNCCFFRSSDEHFPATAASSSSSCAFAHPFQSSAIQWTDPRQFHPAPISLSNGSRSRFLRADARHFPQQSWSSETGWPNPDGSPRSTTALLAVGMNNGCDLLLTASRTEEWCSLCCTLDWIPLLQCSRTSLDRWRWLRSNETAVSLITGLWFEFVLVNICAQCTKSVIQRLWVQVCSSDSIYYDIG